MKASWASADLATCWERSRTAAAPARGPCGLAFPWVWGGFAAQGSLGAHRGDGRAQVAGFGLIPPKGCSFAQLLSEECGFTSALEPSVQRPPSLSLGLVWVLFSAGQAGLKPCS